MIELRQVVNSNEAGTCVSGLLLRESNANASRLQEGSLCTHVYPVSRLAANDIIAQGRCDI